MSETTRRILARGEVVHRFLVLDLLGEGAMGSVYRAYDPELDRTIALKVLRGLAADESGQDRLLREAQALARLQHPNVVAVHDVGVYAGRLFLAMELVDGPTLGELIRAGDRTDMLSRLRDAGAGLASAHRAGLCHRDFKPANVIIDAEGRARVVDFGLARPMTSGLDDEVARGRLEANQCDDPLSCSGLVAGTPAYMAPEARDGGLVDARADQFSFCMTAFEALAGTVPRVCLVPPSVELPALPGVGRRARRALTRGLSIDPGLRFESMDALLDALDPGPARRRSVVALLTVAATGAVVGALGAPGGEAADPCARGREVWNEIDQQPRRTSLGGAIAQAAPKRAAALEAATQGALDRFAQGWISAYDAVCRSEQPAAIATAQRRCLMRRRAEIDALLTALSEATSSERIDAAVPTPEQLQACSAEAVAYEPPPPTEPTEAIAAVQATLARVDAMERVGHFERGLAAANEARGLAVQIDHPPFVAEADYRRGRLLQILGRFDAAESALTAAHWAAEGARADRLAADAAVHLVFVVGVRIGDAERGLVWAEHARAAVRRAGSDPAQRAELDGALGSTHAAAGRYAAARDHFAAEVSLKAEVFGEDSREVAGARTNLAIALEELGDLAAAQAEHRRALALLSRLLGAEHPAVATALTNLAATQLRDGDPESALASYRRAEAIKIATLPAAHPSLVGVHVGIVASLRRLGRLEAAERAGRLAVRHARSSFGDGRPELATARHNLARVLREQGSWSDAAQEQARAVQDWRGAYGDEHPRVGEGLLALAEIEHELGLDAQAHLHGSQAVEIFASTMPDHPRTAEARAALASLGVDIVP